MMNRLTLALALLKMFTTNLGAQASFPSLADSAESNYSQLYLYPGIMIDSVTIQHSGDYWLVGLINGEQTVYRAEEISRVFSDGVDVTQQYPELKNATVPNDRLANEMSIYSNRPKDQVNRTLSLVGRGLFNGATIGLAVGYLASNQLSGVWMGTTALNHLVGSVKLGAVTGAIAGLLLSYSESLPAKPE